MKATVDYIFYQFILIDESQAEDIISYEEACTLYYNNGAWFNDAAKERIEDLQYEEVINHYLREK